MKKWLVVSNCQSTGLKNCLHLLSNEIDVEAYDFNQFKKVYPATKSEFCDYDKIIVAPQFLNTSTHNFELEDSVFVLPTPFFEAYHPDLCYVVDGNKNLLKGPITDYHSIIAVCGYKFGLSVSDTLKLYCAQLYQSFGWLDLWAPSRDRMLDAYSAHGFDLKARFSTWGRESAFMHTVNHPRISCVSDISKVILERFGVEYSDTTLLPHDNLLNGPVFPVYPEIGEAYGVRGSYQFKKSGEYRTLDIEQFVGESFDVYSSTESFEVTSGYAKRFDEVLGYIYGVKG